MADDADNAQKAIDSAMRMALSRVLKPALPANPDPYCDRCGELIGDARKAAMPSALYCIECQFSRESQR